MPSRRRGTGHHVAGRSAGRPVPPPRSRWTGHVRAPSGSPSSQSRGPSRTASAAACGARPTRSHVPLERRPRTPVHELGRPRDEPESEVRGARGSCRGSGTTTSARSVSGKAEVSDTSQSAGLVGLVGDEDEVVTRPRHARPPPRPPTRRGHGARRVARVAEQERPSSRSHGPLDRVRVPPPAVLGRGSDVHRDTARRADRPLEEEATAPARRPRCRARAASETTRPSACIAPFVTTSSRSASTPRGPSPPRTVASRSRSSGIPRRCGAGDASASARATASTRDPAARVPASRAAAPSRRRPPAPLEAARRHRGSGTLSEMGARRGRRGGSTCEGCSAGVEHAWWATCMRVPVPTSWPVLRLRENRGKLELARSSRIRWLRREHVRHRDSSRIGELGEPRPARATRPIRPRGCPGYRARIISSARKIERPSG